VLEFLDELEIPYMLNPTLVRGLDYYNRTVFEIFEEEKRETQSSLIGGGRYDDLAKMIGGKALPAVGFGAGVERIIEAMKESNLRVSRGGGSKIFLIQLGELAKKRGLKLMEMFRKEGILVHESLGRHSIRSQMKIADRLEAKLSLILGQKEALSDEIIIRDMRSGVQETIPLSRVVKEIRRRLAEIK
jgi:histidyl-tRNA synthetase